MASGWDQALDAVAGLGDGVRRSLYAWVRAQHRPVSRDEAAAEVGVSTKLAAFHLDKLVTAGLLRSRPREPQGRGSGAVGRSPNLYEVTDREVRVSIPDRRYELLGTILAGALARSGEGAALVSEEARQRGWESGRSAAVARRLRRPGAERALAVAAEVLAGCGYEPYRDGADVALANCPFHVVAKDAPDLVCGANRAFVDGVLRGLGDERVNAVLVPPDGGCCVRLVGPVERRRRPS